jgi:hypothetical protein
VKLWDLAAEQAPTFTTATIPTQNSISAQYNAHSEPALSQISIHARAATDKDARTWMWKETSFQAANLTLLVSAARRIIWAGLVANGTTPFAVIALFD